MNGRQEEAVSESGLCVLCLGFFCGKEVGARYGIAPRPWHLCFAIAVSGGQEGLRGFFDEQRDCFRFGSGQ